MQRISCCIAKITSRTPADAMKNDTNYLVDTLREIAYDAGYALLCPVDSVTTQRYADRYNKAYHELRALAPYLTACVKPVPADATVGCIRMAARDAASHAQSLPTPCFQRIAA